MPRLLLLVLALALTGCPGDSTGVAKGKALGSARADPPGAAADTSRAGPQPEAPSPEAAGETELVAVSQNATVRDARDGFLFLRSGPSSQTEPLAQMPNGSSVYIDACEPGTEGRRWCRTVFDGRTGWASETGLDVAPRPASPREEASPREATISDPDGWTNLRAEASTRATVVTRLLNGSTVEVQACIPAQNGSRSRWCEVDAFTVTDGALRGWIAESRLRYN